MFEENPLVRKAMAQIAARRDDNDVVHVCPECGGRFADHLGASGIVTLCWACGGKGTLTNAEMDGYLSRSRDQSSGFTIN